MTLESARWARLVALGVAWRGRDILVSEGFDSVKEERFYRLLGGTIEFGESGADAVVRELREEIGVDIYVTRYLGTLENLFTFEGVDGHELARVYEVEAADDAFYAEEEHPRTDGVPTRVLWKPIDALSRERLYPHGLSELFAE